MNRKFVKIGEAINGGNKLQALETAPGKLGS